MGKTVAVRAAGSVTANLTEHNWFGDDGTNTLTELNAQAVATEACTFSRVRFFVNTGGSGTNNHRFRKNGADGNQLASRVGVGFAEDDTNTDVLAANDLFNVAYTDTGSDSGIRVSAVTVEFSSGHGGFHGGAALTGVICDVASATRFLPLGGRLHHLRGFAGSCSYQRSIERQRVP